MYTIREGVTVETVEKKSRFICEIMRVSTVDEAEEKIGKIKEAHPTASHNVSAYIVGINRKYDDDKEPHRTAGMPLLNVLEKKELTGIVAVVTRYYGGIKLGAGGLVRAYTNSLVEALNNAEITEVIPMLLLKVSAEYSDVEKINYLFKKYNHVDYKISYGPKVQYEAEIPETIAEDLIEEIKKYNHLIKIEKINY